MTRLRKDQPDGLHPVLRDHDPVTWTHDLEARRIAFAQIETQASGAQRVDFDSEPSFSVVPTSGPARRVESPAEAPAPRPKRRRRTAALAKGAEQAGVRWDKVSLAASIRNSVPPLWIGGGLGPLDAAWIPSVGLSATGKLVALVQLIDSHLSRISFNRWSAQVDQVEEPSLLILRRPGRSQTFPLAIRGRIIRLQNCNISLATPRALLSTLDELSMAAANFFAHP